MSISTLVFWILLIFRRLFVCGELLWVELDSHDVIADFFVDFHAEFISDVSDFEALVGDVVLVVMVSRSKKIQSRLLWLTARTHSFPPRT